MPLGRRVRTEDDEPLEPPHSRSPRRDCTSSQPPHNKMAVIVDIDVSFIVPRAYQECLDTATGIGEMSWGVDTQLLLRIINCRSLRGCI